MKKITALLFAAACAASAAAGAAPVSDHAKGPLPLHVSHGDPIELTQYLVPGKTTIFDFYSDYCPPCRALSPMLEKLHQQRADVAVVKVDINRPGVEGIDWDSPVAHEFDLHSIPDLRIYTPKGALQAQGQSAREMVIDWIQALP